MMPSYFIAHGSPMLAIENNEYTEFVKLLGNTIPKPKAIVLFSAHWESNVQKVSNLKQYQTIHDFYGFPEELFRIEYPAKGDHKIARDIEDFLKKQGISYAFDTERGLDHGAWVVLKMLYPNAEIPVISMSVSPKLAPQEQYNIGKSLSELRDKDILIIASGGTVHNLGAVKFRDEGTVDQWALEFDQWLEKHMNQWDLASLFNYASSAPNGQLAVPPNGNEHFIPIFYAMGAADNSRTAKLLHRSYRYGNLSHSIWQFG